MVMMEPADGVQRRREQAIEPLRLRRYRGPCRVVQPCVCRWPRKVGGSSWALAVSHGPGPRHRRVPALAVQERGADGGRVSGGTCSARDRVGRADELAYSGQRLFSMQYEFARSAGLLGRRPRRAVRYTVAGQQRCRRWSAASSARPRPRSTSPSRPTRMWARTSAASP